MHISDIGTLALQLGFGLSLYSVATSIWGAQKRRADWIASGEQAAYATFACVVLATGILLHALLSRDFNIEYVSNYSSSTLPLHYTVASLWGGMAGSLLFWALILTGGAAVVLFQNRERNRELMPWVTATLMTTTAFFMSLIVFVTPVFRRLAFTPADGSDLNPLLQNYWMMIHPPALYLGFVTVSIPFAFCIAALATGRLGETWFQTTRRWTLTAWFFLTCGNILGGAWAYEVLGWGGYWAWDPVENAAFMPWLVMTAFLHSVMIQEKKGMLKVWNVSLIVVAFLLTIFGTFLTRSGVISSVHSFTQSNMGPFFLSFLGFAGIIAIGLIIYRLEDLRSQNELESFVSREAAFLFNNLILLGICFAVFWGTVFPVVSEWVRGVKITVGPPFFNRVNAPLGLILLFLTGVGPLIAWRRATPKNLIRNFAMPVGVAIGGGLMLIVLGMRNFGALVSFSLCMFVASSIFAEFYRGTRARQRLVGETAFTALRGLVAKNRRRYGGYIVHLGIVLIFLGLTGSSIFKDEIQVTVNAGEVIDLAPYQLRFDEVQQWDDPHVSTSRAKLTVFEAGAVIGELFPERRFYKRPQQPTTEVSIRRTMRDDVYVVFGAFDPESGLATFQLFRNPLVSWLWIGGLVMILGTGVAMSPSLAERHARAAKREDEDEDAAVRSTPS